MLLSEHSVRRPQKQRFKKNWIIKSSAIICTPQKWSRSLQNYETAIHFWTLLALWEKTKMPPIFLILPLPSSPVIVVPSLTPSSSSSRRRRWVMRPPSWSPLLLPSLPRPDGWPIAAFAKKRRKEKERARDDILEIMSASLTDVLIN